MYKVVSYITRGLHSLHRQEKYLLFLESHNRVLHNIIHANLTALSDDLRVLAHEKPTNVSKEEAAVSVMGVSVSLRVLVVDSMVTTPLVNVILYKKKGNINNQFSFKNVEKVIYLKSHSLDKSEENTKGQASLVRAVSPETMAASSDTQATHLVENKCYNNEILVSFSTLEIVCKKNIPASEVCHLAETKHK